MKSGRRDRRRVWLTPSEVVRLLEYYPGLEQEYKAMVPLKQVYIPTEGK